MWAVEQFVQLRDVGVRVTVVISVIHLGRVDANRQGVSSRSLPCIS